MTATRTRKWEGESCQMNGGLFPASNLLVDKRTHRYSDRQTDRQTHTHTHARTHARRQTDRQTHARTHAHTHTHTRKAEACTYSTVVFLTHSSHGSPDSIMYHPWVCNNSPELFSRSFSSNVIPITLEPQHFKGN